MDIAEEKGFPSLRYSVDHSCFSRLCEERLGRTILVTDHTDWPDEKVIRTYRGLASIEDTFKNMKNTHYFSWSPAYHWTDQKIRVHAFYCVLALTCASLANKVVSDGGVKITLPAMLKELSQIREVAVIYPAGTLAHPKDHVTLSRMSAKQRRLAELLEIVDAVAPGRG